MKVAIFTDLHIADRGSQMKGSLQRLQYCNKFVDWFLDYIKERGDIDLIVNCGDLTSSDSLSATESTALHLIMSKFGNYLRENPDIMMVNVLGNHERKDKSGTANSINSVNAYSERMILEISGYGFEARDKSCYLKFVAYGNREELKASDEYEKQYLFTHEDFYPESLSKMVGGIDHSEVKGYTRVFNGHVHNSSEFENIVNIGSCLGSNFSDDYSTARPGIIILDTETDEIERIENPTSPLYFTISSIDYLELPTTVVDRCYIRIDSPDVIKELKESNNLDVLKIYANVSVPNVIEDNNNNVEVISLDSDDDIVRYLLEYYKGNESLQKEIKDIMSE